MLWVRPELERTNTQESSGLVAGVPANAPLTVRLEKNRTTYGALLEDSSSTNASKVRMQTAAGVKAWQKLP